MAVYFNPDTFESELLDVKNEGILLENWTYVVDQLIKYVNPNISNKHKKLPEIIGGQRRIVRAMRGSKLGYNYTTAADKAAITNKGTKVIQAFGDDVLVEEWTVSHGDIKDPDLGERYPTKDSNGDARSPYTCLLTARIDIKNRTAKRCYLQCNCKDFQVSFYSRLNSEAYTNPQSLPAPTGKVAQAPAMCKHLYAIYSKYYTDLVNSTEKYNINSSPVLNGGSGPAPTPPTVPAGPVVAKTRQEAEPLIIARIKQEFSRLGKMPEAYFDSRGKAAGGGRHHLHIFSVILLNGNLRAIAYRNKETADLQFKNNAPIQLLHIPDNPKIWQLFTKPSDHALFWSWIKTYAGPMPDRMNKAIKLKTGVAVYLENNIIELSDLQYLDNSTHSNILQSIIELS